MVRSTRGVVLGLVGSGDFFPRYYSNIAAVSDLMEDFKASKGTKCSSLDTREFTRIWEGLY
jgi:hypothetical protein